MISPSVRRSSVRGVVVCGVLAGGLLLGLEHPATAADAAVSATSDNVFEPPRVAVNVGDSVTWTTTSGINHTVTSSSANWTKDDAIQVPGRSTSYTFEAPGTYTYYCKTHGSPTAGMRGSVAVAAPTRPPAPPPTARPTPSPRPPTARPTPSPTASRPPAPPASPSARPAAPSPSATATRTTAPPPPLGLPSSSPGALPSESAVPLPSVAEEPTDLPTVDLGSGGLGPRPVSDRGRGLPTFLALVALVGVLSAQVRALLALPVDDPAVPPSTEPRGAPRGVAGAD